MRRRHATQLGRVIDSSVMVAGLVTNHEFHTIARPHLTAAADGKVPGIVLAETWTASRRAPWNLDARTVEAALAPWADEDHVAATPAAAYTQVLRTGRSLNLGCNVHDMCRGADGKPTRSQRRDHFSRVGLFSTRRRRTARNPRPRASHRSRSPGCR